MHTTPVNAAQSISTVGGYTAFCLLEMLGVGKKKKKEIKAEEQSRGSTSIFVKLQLSGNKTEEIWAFPILLYTSSIPKAGGA